MSVNQDLEKKLDELNTAVEKAMAARKAWMDEHMPDFAKYKIGETLFNLQTGESLGVVCEYYRYQADRNPIYDTSMHIEYRLKKSKNTFDNTSRFGGSIIYGNAQEAQEWLEFRIKEFNH